MDIKKNRRAERHGHNKAIKCDLRDFNNLGVQIFKQREKIHKGKTDTRKKDKK